MRMPPRTQEEAAHVPGRPQHGLQLQRHGPVEVRSWISRQQAQPRALQLHVIAGRSSPCAWSSAARTDAARPAVAE